MLKLDPEAAQVLRTLVNSAGDVEDMPDHVREALGRVSEAITRGFRRNGRRTSH